MSNKLKNIATGWHTFDEAGDDFSQVGVGAHVIKIMNVENDDEKEYLKIYFDINEGELKGHYKEQFERFGNDKWPFDATVFQSYKQSALPFFKRFITAIEKSNLDYSFVKTNGDFEKLKGKLLVAVFGETEIPVPDENNDNKPKVRVKFREFRSIEALKNGDIKVPDDVKTLSSDYDKEKYAEALQDIKGAFKEEKEVDTELFETSIKLTGDDDLPF